MKTSIYTKGGVIFAIFALVAMTVSTAFLGGCGTATLPKPNNAQTAGVEALVAYGLAAHVANQYLALPVCSKPLTAVPCKTLDIAAKVKAADLVAYNAAAAADKAANDPAVQSAATTALTQLQNANSEANGGKQ